MLALFPFFFFFKERSKYFGDFLRDEVLRNGGAWGQKEKTITTTKKKDLKPEALQLCQTPILYRK